MPLAPDIQQQDTRFKAAFALVDDAIEHHAFPGASLAVAYRGRLVAWRGFGHFIYEAESPRVSPTTVFDLASVTKAAATTVMAMLLYERGELDLAAPVVTVLPEFAGAKAERDVRRQSVTVRMLLAHSSGLPAYERLFESCRTREELLNAAMTMPLVAAPGERAEYSDIGFIMLGEVLARIADEPLDRFCQREVFGPLGMATATFNPPAEWKLHIPPTVDDHRLRQRVVQGEVHDENAFILGGISGHAGLFGSAYDMALLAHCMLRGGRPILRAETVAMFTKGECAPTGTSRALGWDTPSQPSQSGKHFSPRSFGHLGYTGTSLWCDPERELSVTLLTNRVWPDCASQAIKQVRPAVHDAIVEALEEE